MELIFFWHANRFLEKHLSLKEKLEGVLPLLILSPDVLLVRYSMQQERFKGICHFFGVIFFLRLFLSIKWKFPKRDELMYSNAPNNVLSCAYVVKYSFPDRVGIKGHPVKSLKKGATGKKKDWCNFPILKKKVHSVFTLSFSLPFTRPYCVYL